jgi:hypothetical protein
VITNNNNNNNNNNDTKKTLDKIHRQILESSWSNNNNNKKDKVTILRNQQVKTGRTIPNNKPDIIIRDNEKGTCMLIDVSISGGRNVIKKEAEKC